MALTDLINPITLPNGLDTANNNPIAKAEKVVVTGTNQSVTEALGDRENSLGNPDVDGKVLASTVDGVRSWQTVGGGSEQEIATLESKVAALYPLTPNVGPLNDFAGIYDPIHGSASVTITDGYSLIADYRAIDDRYESSGVGYDASGTDVIRYSDLTGDLHRSFAFKVNAITQVNTVTLTGTNGTADITINGVDYLAVFATDLSTTGTNFVTTHATALATAGITVTKGTGNTLVFTANVAGTGFSIEITNVSGDLDGAIDNTTNTKTLMSIVDGAELIPFIDITASGRLRANDFVPEHTVNQEIRNQIHTLVRTGGTEVVTTTPGSVAIFTITNFPASSTNKTRRISIDPNIRLNGVDTLAGRAVEVSAPSENIAQAKRTVTDTVFLGPLYQNRSANITIGYEFRVDGANLLMDLTLESASLSSGSETISVDFEPNTFAYLSYTSQTTIDRQDRWVEASGLSGNHLITGESEFILSSRPDLNQDGTPTGRIDMVPALVVGSGSIEQLNDVTVSVPTPLWDMVEIPDDIEFRTYRSAHYFRHSEIAALLANRTVKWSYGLARLETPNSGKSLTEAIDLHTGTTLNGNAISVARAESVVYEATNKGTGTGGLVDIVQLPENYGDWRYIHVTEYDVSSLQFRHTEFPVYILTSGLTDTNDNIRLQGNTVMRWDATNRQLFMSPSSDEIFRVALKD